MPKPSGAPITVTIASTATIGITKTATRPMRNVWIGSRLISVSAALHLACRKTGDEEGRQEHGDDDPE